MGEPAAGKPVIAGAQAVPAATPSRPTGLALLLLAGMGALFFSSYGLANWLASQRAGVPSLHFAWERQIPFVPWTILPYWSIDLLYAISFFLWHTRPALLTHVKRLLLAQLISVACFIAFPLRFGFERPAADGWTGQLFTLLGGFDKPFNQAPSLHISLLFILWVAYAAHVRGAWRWLLHGWFALIGISVLTSYQHPVIDVPTGWLAGCLCVFACPLRDDAAGFTRTPTAQTGRLTRRYSIGAAGLALLSLISFQFSVVLCLLLAWSALALACVALVYRSGLPGGFGKGTDGSLPTASWWLLAPYLLGAFLNSRWWTRHQPAPTQLAEDVWIGRFPASTQLRRTRATAVLDLTAELPRLLPSLAYRCIPVLDLTVPSQANLRLAVETIGFWRASGKTVLICCALGYSRSALVAAAWLSHQQPDLDDPAQVLAQLRDARPGVVLGPPSVAALATFMQETRAARSTAARANAQGAGHAG